MGFVHGNEILSTVKAKPRISVTSQGQLLNVLSLHEASTSPCKNDDITGSHTNKHHFGSSSWLDEHCLCQEGATSSNSLLSKKSVLH